MHYYKSNNEIMQYCIVSNDIALIMHYHAVLKRSDTYYVLVWLILNHQMSIGRGPLEMTCLLHRIFLSAELLCTLHACTSTKASTAASKKPPKPRFRQVEPRIFRVLKIGLRQVFF